MFKNMIVYRIAESWQGDLQLLEEALGKSLFAECGATQERSAGWVPPRGEPHGPLAESVANQWVMRFMTEAKMLPASVLNRRVEEKAAHIEATEGRKPGKKEKKELKDEAKLDLLAMAPRRRHHFWCGGRRRHALTAPGSSSRTGAPRRRGPLAQAMLISVGIALFLGFIFLGSWQVQRRAWKLDLIERVEQRVHAAPAALPPPAEWPQITAADHEYRAVQASGQWLGGKTVLTQAVTELGAGFWVLTPLQLDDGSQVLVNRGFIPTEQRARWQAQPAQAQQDKVTVAGLLRISEPRGGFLRENDAAQQRWFSRDVQAIAQAQGLDRAAPYFIDAGLPGQPVADGTWPRPGMTVIRFPNSHLVYALTWYGLALMVVGAAWLVRRNDRQPGKP
jgi:surfeit locus 1 family protein